MTLNPGETSLVIAGAWNPAILTPAWVLQFGLNRPGSDEPVQIAIPANAAGVIEYPKFTLPEFTYIVRHESLIVSPTEATPVAIGRVEEAVAAMLDSLPHTPITGVGHNFEFRDTNPQPEILGVFTRASQDLADGSPEGWNSTGTMITSSFRYANGTTVANIQRQFDGSKVIVKFNFHHPLTTVPQALDVLRGQNNHARMEQNFRVARDLITQLYGPIQ